MTSLRVTSSACDGRAVTAKVAAKLIAATAATRLRNFFIYFLLTQLAPSEMELKVKALPEPYLCP